MDGWRTRLSAQGSEAPCRRIKRRSLIPCFAAAAPHVERAGSITASFSTLIEACVVASASVEQVLASGVIEVPATAYGGHGLIDEVHRAELLGGLGALQSNED